MKGYHVFIKSLKEQFREVWILVLTLCFAPMFVFLYYLMSETETPVYRVILVNGDETRPWQGEPVNLGDSLVRHLGIFASEQQEIMLKYAEAGSRDEGIQQLTEGRGDALLVIPPDLTAAILGWFSSAIPGFTPGPGPVGIPSPSLELVGDITDMKYIVGAVWTEELVNQFALNAAGLQPPVSWKETALGHSGKRTAFELYVPGLMIFAVIMMMFTASATIVREPETGTIERLKISNLKAPEYLAGISLVQVLIGIVSLLLTMGTAVALGYELIPGTLGFILFTGFLTSLSMISFSLIVAAMCRSVKDVAIIGTFPLMVLMFFSGAFFPLGGGKIARFGNYTLHLNDLLSPTWAVDALNKVLVKGLPPMATLPEMAAILALTGLYLLLGIWAYRRRHMKSL
jgi:ABC-2 type transport system permease protein